MTVPERVQPIKVTIKENSVEVGEKIVEREVAEKWKKIWEEECKIQNKVFNANGTR